MCKTRSSLTNASIRQLSLVFIFLSRYILKIPHAPPNSSAIFPSCPALVIYLLKGIQNLLCLGIGLLRTIYIVMRNLRKLLHSLHDFHGLQPVCRYLLICRILCMESSILQYLETLALVSCMLPLCSVMISCIRCMISIPGRNLPSMLSCGLFNFVTRLVRLLCQLLDLVSHYGESFRSPPALAASMEAFRLNRFTSLSRIDVTNPSLH